MDRGARGSQSVGAGRAAGRLLAAACLAALLMWVVAPSGAGGQQYPLPPPPPPPPATPELPPPSPLPPQARPLALLSPFPIVRIVSRTTARGARIRVLTVRAAVGTYVVSRCIGTRARCPYKQRVSRIPGRVGRVGTIHVKPFERSFRSGVVLRIYVVNTGRTGKFTSFSVRRRAAPRRNDGCVADVVLKPVSCPER